MNHSAALARSLGWAPEEVALSPLGWRPNRIMAMILKARNALEPETSRKSLTTLGPERPSQARPQLLNDHRGQCVAPRGAGDQHRRPTRQRLMLRRSNRAVFRIWRRRPRLRAVDAKTASAPWRDSLPRTAQSIYFECEPGCECEEAHLVGDTHAIAFIRPRN